LKYRNTDAAAEALAQWVRNVVNDGFRIEGLNIEAVKIFDTDITNPIPDPPKVRPPVQSPAYTGHICPDCSSSRVVPSGSCETCQDCGSTTGCG
jgi:hypothetical protein